MHGNVQRDCPENKPSEIKFKCYNYGEWGHKSPACPKPRGTTSFAPAGSSGSAASSVGSQVRPGRVFVVTRQDADIAPEVVTGTFLVSGHYARVLLDSGASHSFVSLSFGVVMGKTSSVLPYVFSIASPLGDPVLVQSWYPWCEISMGGRSFFVDFIMLPMTDFDVILGMDFLSNYHAVIDCLSKVVVFQIPDEAQVRICGEGALGKCRLISSLRASSLSKQGFQNF